MSESTAEAHAASEPVSAAEQFLEKNFKKLMLLVLFAIVGLLAYGFVRYKAQQAAIAAAEQFTGAKTIEDCDLVISQHPGTPATGNARLLKADLLWEENKKDSSTSVLREFLKENEGHPLYATAMLGLASKLESMGEKDEAQELFQRVSSEFPDSAVAPLARIRLGDLLWSQGKEDEAAEIYETLATEFPDTNEPFYDQSQSRLEWLTAKLPTKEVEPPAEVKAAEEAKKAAAAAAQLPAGLKPPQINVDGTLGATVSPDGGALTPPISPMPTPPSGAPQAPATVKQNGITVPPAVAKEAADAKKKVSDEATKAKAKAKSGNGDAKKAKAPAPKSTDAPEPKAKAAPKPKAEESAAAPAPAPAPAKP